MYNYLTYITNDNKLFLYGFGKNTEIEGIEINDNTILTTGNMIISNGEVYHINANATVSKTNYTNVEPYYNTYEDYQFIQNKGMKIFKMQDGTIRIYGSPIVTKIGEKSNYELRKVFENAIFVQGKGSNISIVDRNGKVYESTIAEANSKIENAKKIISSSSAKYIIKEDRNVVCKR